jgi:ATP-dependent helicase HrpB
VAAALDGRLPPDCPALPLYGALPGPAQRAALTPAAAGTRRVILATAIAETALTIPDVRVVVDAGRARRARFDPGSGMGRLVTERVTRAEADQRRGRAGRVAPGVCYRMWTKGEEGALAAFPPAEIEVADLAPLALELALWGARGAEGLAFLTPPPAGALAEARALLEVLGALAPDGGVTAHGRALARLPLHPRLGHMLLRAGAAAAPLAALLSARDPLRGAPCDLLLRRDAMTGRRIAAGSADPAAIDRLRQEAKRLERDLARTTARDGSNGRRTTANPDATGPDRDRPPQDSPSDWAAMAALAYPDRIGLRRAGEAPRWLLSGGKGAVMDPGDPLAGARLIVATDLDGDPREARIRQAAMLSEAAVRRIFAKQIGWVEVCAWSPRDRRVLARQQERLGALVLADRPWHDPPPEALARAALDGFRALGPAACGMTPTAHRLQARAEFLRSRGTPLPDLSDAGLLAAAETGADWLAASVARCRNEADLRGLDLTGALQAALGWEGGATLDRLAPGVFVTPLDRRVAIDYTSEGPTVALRLQEMFGTTTHPTVGPDRTPLRLVLLSPAGRPVQVTADLPGFWTTSYADVRKDMRGQYPKHPWPEDPAAAPPTLRAKPKEG